MLEEQAGREVSVESARRKTGFGWRRWSRRPLPMSDEYAGFLLLNMFDLFLTGYIFRHGGEEVNPVGIWVMDRFGMSGFAVFKFAMVAFAILIIEVIYRLRPDRARSLLNTANLVYLGVILWECVLLLFRAI